jgi:integrase
MKHETAGLGCATPRIIISGDCLVLDEAHGPPGYLLDRIRTVAERAMRAVSPPPPPDGMRTPAEATSTKCTAQQINRLIERFRASQPPELPEGKREERYHDPALPGFYIRQLNTGVATWTLQYKSLGRQKKIALGRVLVLDRQEAIKAAKELLAKVTLDTLDPHKARRERMRANKVTFATLVPLFMAEKRQVLRPGSAYQFKNHLTGYYFKPLHNLPIDEITRDQIQTQIAAIAIQSGKGAARNCCTTLGVFFTWASETSKLPEGHHNPMTNVQPPKQNSPRERVLTDDEIRLIWKACEEWEAKAIRDQRIIALGKGRKKLPHIGAPYITDFSRAVRLLFLTGCRRQEIGELRWDEIDLDNAQLCIPPQRTKKARELFNPLSAWAVEILRSIERRPDSDCVFGHSKRLPGLRLNDAHKDIDKLIARAGGTPPKGWTLHDIRRTFRTRLAALRVSTDVAEALVGHVGHRTDMDRVYNKYKYWPEKQQALAKWKTHLRAVIDGTADKIAYPRFGERKEGDTE